MKQNGKSARLREYAHIILNRALKDAVKKRLLAYNVMLEVDKPKAERPDVSPMTQEQVSLFLKAAEVDRLYALYHLAIATGMRQGELLALEWKDINLRSGQITVTKTLGTCDGELRLGPTKTNKSRRTIRLPDEARKVLVAHRQRMLADGNIGGPVFCDSKGGPLRANNLLQRSFKPLLKKAKLPDFRFHDLRHTTATLLMERGVNAKVIQGMLGHSTVNTTLTYYGHVTPSMEDHAANMMDNLLTEQTCEDGDGAQDHSTSRGA
jgi:integrase